MPEWFNLLLLPTLTAILGVLIVAPFTSRGTGWTLPLGFAALAVGIMVVGWVGLVIAEFGFFGWWPLVAVIGGLIAVLFVWRLVSPHTVEAIQVPPDEDRWATWELLMLVAWLVAALWLFFRPHEYIQGGADAGVYVSLGAEIAQNGGFRIDDETLGGLSSEMQAAVLRPLPNTPGASSYLLPGFYVTDAAGRLTPQFYPLHPVLQAVAFAAAGGGQSGVRAELLLTGLWMMLGMLAVYLTARDVGGPFVGALALAGLSLSALQVWFGRYPTSEALTQLLLWLGIWGGGRWLGARRPVGLWAFLAGCAFGAVFLVRIDTLVLLPVFSLLLVWRWARGWERADSWFAVPFVLLVIHSLLHGYFLSGPYFYETIGYGLLLLQRLWPLTIAAIVVAALFLWWLSRHAGELRSIERLRRPALAALVALWIGYALYGWFLRPALPATLARPDFFSGGEIPVTNHLNWLRLGWYLTPLGVWLGVLGSGLLLWRVNRRTALLLAIGLLFSVLYLWNVSANPHHVYVMRRYVPAVLPFFVLSGAYLLGHRGLGRLAWSPPPDLLSRIPYPLSATLVAFATIIWLLGIGWAARGFVSQVDYVGLTEQLDGLAGRLPPGAVLLFNDQSAVGQGDVWGTPLKFIYGYDVFALRQPPASVSPALVETIKTWQNSGKPIVWIGDTGWLDEQGIAYHNEQTILNNERLESSYDHKPTAIVPDTVSLTLSFLESN